MGITLQYISQRLSLLKKRLCLLRLRLCLLRMRVVLLVRCLVERLLLISDWIVKRILLISKSMLLLVAYLKTRKNSVSILACQASAFCVLLTLLSTTALSSIPSTNTKNIVLEASLDCTCDGTTPYYELLPEMIQDTTECSKPQSQEIISSVIENVSTDVKNIDNRPIGDSVNVNHKRLEIETVYRVSNKSRKYFTVGINPWTTMFHWGNVAFDLLEHNISVPRSLKPLVTCLKNNITISHFCSTRTTSRGDRAHSEAMFWRTYVEQRHHELMFTQMLRVYRYVDPRHMLVLLHHFVHPAEPFPPIPVLNEDGINAVGVMTRAYFMPQYLAGNIADIPEVINVENHMVAPNHRMKTINSGFVFEFKPLNPTLLLLKQEGFWARYLQRRVDITLQHTRTNIIKTNMIDTRVNVSGVGLDILRSIISKTPVIKKATPVVNRLSLLAQEFVALELHLQLGLTYGDVVNFNVQQELQRTARMSRYNWIIMQNMQQREVTFFQPMNRRNYENHLAEIHSKSFHNVGFVITIDIDLFEKLAKFRKLKHK